MKTLICIFGLLVSFGINLESYCKCEQNESIKKEVENSDLVVIGNIVKKNIRLITKGNSNLKFVEYQIRLNKSYKGIKKGRTIFVYTTQNSASCGINLELNQKYVIFGNKGTYLPPRSANLLGEKAKRSFWVNSCSRTGTYTVEIENEIEKIGAIKTELN